MIYGFNIAVLVSVLLAVTLPFLGHKWSAWIVLADIALFAALVGAEPAVVRAASMGALFVIATRFLGRPTLRQDVQQRRVYGDGAAVIRSGIGRRGQSFWAPEFRGIGEGGRGSFGYV